MQKTSLHGASINNRYVSNILHYYQLCTSYIHKYTYDDDDQPKLRGSGVVVTLVCKGICGVFHPKLVISRGKNCVLNFK